jgi:ABC-type Zn2+ transport system substrate-binding protein/surface adhesin
MISKKINQLLKVSLIIIGMMTVAVGSMYLLSRMICKKSNGHQHTACGCSHNHNHRATHSHEHEERAIDAEVMNVNDEATE